MSSHKERKGPLSEGPVPDISLASTSGSPVRLRDLERAIIYFYPRDHTPGCTAQACGFRDTHASLIERGWSVYGISTDTIERHRGFIEKHGLGFTLLSDSEHRAADAFGVQVKRSMFGKTFLSTKRVTFAIERGAIVQVWPRADPLRNAQEVLDWIDSRDP